MVERSCRQGPQLSSQTPPQRRHFEVHTIYGFITITFPPVEEHFSVCAFSNVASTLAKLDHVDAAQAVFAEML
jgi:hypothetical protein